MSHERPIHHLSLCAGLGGIDLGLRRCLPNLRTVGMVEREAYLSALLVSKMEEGLLDPCPIFGDLVSFDWARYRGLIHLVSGGFPCQPFSSAGKQLGVDDPRHLWPYIRDGLEILRPEIVFFENVAGISTAKSPGYHSVLHHVLSDLEGLGFQATAGEFSAAEVGAPHLRKRWFILGLADSDGNPCRPEQSRRTDRELREEGRGLLLWESQRETGEKSRGSGSDELADGERKRLEGHSGDEIGKNRLQPFSESGSTSKGCLQLADPLRGGSSDRLSEPTHDQTLEHQSPNESTRWPSRPGQPQYQWEPPRTTEPGLGRDSDGLSDRMVPYRIDRLRALGNAVVPAVAERAFRSLMHELTA